MSDSVDINEVLNRTIPGVQALEYVSISHPTLGSACADIFETSDIIADV